MSAVLTCTDVKAGYVARQPVVRDFDLSLEPGEIVALLGPNGAGKTTLLMSMAGLIPTLGGRIEIGAVPAKPGNARAAVKAGLVLVPDDRALFKGLSVRENLRLAGRRGGTTVERVLEYFPALGKRLRVSSGALSGGEQQMLAIGRALMQDPKVLLIDELSMGLAPVVVESLLPVIRQVCDETGAATILVEQHVMLALGIADTAIVLSHGSVALREPAALLRDDESRIERAYLGTAPAGH